MFRCGGLHLDLRLDCWVAASHTLFAHSNNIREGENGRTTAHRGLLLNKIYEIVAERRRKNGKWVVLSWIIKIKPLVCNEGSFFCKPQKIQGLDLQIKETTKQKYLLGSHCSWARIHWRLFSKRSSFGSKSGTKSLVRRYQAKLAKTVPEHLKVCHIWLLIFFV